MTSDTKKKEGTAIRLLALAIFQKSHGYERVIKGLAQYYQRSNVRRVELYFVGKGVELIKYRNLVKKYRLEDYVSFCGIKTGDELDRIYDMIDIALGPFGLYKRKVHKSSALKIREYLAKGLPIISGCHEDAFEGEKEYKFYLEFPSDNTVVDIQLIVDFYKDIYETDMERNQIHRIIREYAKRKVDMSITMLPVIEYINGQ